ncbi:hypothetical protein [Prosthecobacter sp.]|uniref:hypothetical protein n=1 Tax=Prosthecobacter sp. TaxID=1965333 RepID=UPI003783ECA0
MIRHFLSKRYVRIALWIFTTLATLVVLLHVWTNWSGRRRWAAAKAMLDQEGETLDYRKLLPETPPEAQNLLAIEPLRDIATVIDHDDSKGGPGAKRKALDSMKWSGSAPAGGGVTLGKTTDFQEWAKFLREIKYLDLPAEPSPAASDVLAALDAKFPLLKQMADESVRRPLAMMTPGLREREMPDLLFSLRVPHYTAAQTLAKALSLRGRAAVAAGASAEAARCIISIQRLAQGCKQEPLLIGFLVGNSLEAMAQETLWLGLQQRVFAEEDLRLLQDLFSTSHTREALLRAVRGELASGMNAVEYLQQAANGRKEVDAEILGAFTNQGKSRSLFIWRAIPSGLFDHWKSVIAEMEVQHLIQPLKTSGLRESVAQGEAVATELTKNSNPLLHPDHLMARLILPAVSMVSLNALVQDARQQQALAALALERYFVKHGRYPAVLSDLTPEFLPAAPLDPCDGKPLRYRTTPAGRYQLWSVAFDGKDDNGKVTVDSQGKAKLTKREYVGDWTWQYEPVK